MDINLTEKQSKNLVNDLLKEINQYSLFNTSKTDICDFLLYILNKHSDGKLFSHTNTELSRLLKLTPIRISNARNNISIKFMNDTEYKDIFDKFIRDLKNKNIKYHKEKDDKIVFVIEDKALKTVLESKLKSKAFDTLEYDINNEKVKININSFLCVLKKEKICDDNDIKAAIKQLQKTKNINIATKIASGALSIVSSSLADITTDVFSDILNYIIKDD